MCLLKVVPSFSNHWEPINEFPELVKSINEGLVDNSFRFYFIVLNDKGPSNKGMQLVLNGGSH